MNVSLLIFFIIILLAAVLLLYIITTRGPKKTTLNIEKYRSAWLKIEQSVVKGNEPTYHLAILNADKLVDQALRQKGISGQTMGERMKSAQDFWTNANHIWTAHKLRNQIAHETSVKVRYDVTRRVLQAYKQALKDLGAI